jgi:hypothetical protein
MLTQSEHIDQLAAALADVQALIDGVLKDSPNAVYGSRYADLSKVWEAFQRVGPDHGLSVVQLPGTFDPEARTMAMSVRLMHSSGQWLGGEMSMPLSRADAHAYGSACTYARRYSLAALVGICPHDDDGNAAAGVEVSANRIGASTPCRPRVAPHAHGLRYVSQMSTSAPTMEPKVQTDELPEALSKPERPAVDDPQQLEELQNLLKFAGVEVAALCRHYRVSELSDLSPRDAARARRALTKKIEAKVKSKSLAEAC